MGKKWKNKPIEDSIDAISEEIGFPYEQYLYVRYKEDELSFHDIESELTKLGTDLSDSTILSHAKWLFGKNFIRTKSEKYELQGKKFRQNCMTKQHSSNYKNVQTE